MDANLSEFTRELEAGKVFFFAGSGISYKSNLPKAFDILKHTIRAFLPRLNDKQVDELCSIQPEVFYEVVLDLTETYESLHIWRSLFPKTWMTAGIKCKPNLAHFFIVKHSFDKGVPIFTTNFDVMFEMAAKELSIPYQLLLPNDTPRFSGESKLSICKLHGTIQDEEGKYTPDSLATTMTAITKFNVPWVRELGLLMEKAHLCFVGYSGRDVDLFPHISAYAKSNKTFAVYWINKFEGDHSDIASKECGAIRIEDSPEKAFREIIKSGDILSSTCMDMYEKMGDVKHNMLGLLSDELSSIVNGTVAKYQVEKVGLDWIDVSKKLIENDWAEQISSAEVHLKANLDATKEAMSKVFGNNFSKILPVLQQLLNMSENERLLLHALLKMKLSRFTEAFSSLQGLASNGDKSIRPRLMCHLLLILSRLGLEVARFESSYKYSCNAMNHVKTYGKHQLDRKRQLEFEIQCRILRCESLRMEIPGEAYFDVKQSLYLVLFELSVIFNFIYVYIIIYFKMLCLKQDFKDLSPAAQQDLFEHQIRFWSLFQSGLLLIGSNNRDWLRKLFGNIWNRLQRKCELYGYATGIAHAINLRSRLIPEIAEWGDADNIYDILKYSTGKGLNLRNHANIALQKNSYVKAERLFRELISEAESSGVTLHEIKGLLGLAMINIKRHRTPLLAPSDFNRLKKLVGQVEGRFWKEFFDITFYTFFKHSK